MIQSEKRIFKKQVNHMAWGLILYTILVFGIVVLDMLVKASVVIWNGNVADEAEEIKVLDEVLAKAVESGSSSIVAVVVGVLILYVYFRKTAAPKELFEKKNIMKPKIFGQFLCVFMAIQFFALVAGDLMEKGFNIFGYSIVSSLETASGDAETISMFFYVALLGPVAEELVYRGFVLQTLKKNGKVFAIVASSILFGVMHANLPQSLFAFMVGLVLGYVAMEYSIWWSILLHVLNNGVFGCLLSMALSGFGEKTQECVELFIMVVFFIVGVIVLWKKRKEIKDYIQTYRTEKIKYAYAFTTIGMILFIVVQMLMAVSDVERL